MTSKRNNNSAQNSAMTTQPYGVNEEYARKVAEQAIDDFKRGLMTYAELLAIVPEYQHDGGLVTHNAIVIDSPIMDESAIVESLDSAQVIDSLEFVPFNEFDESEQLDSPSADTAVISTESKLASVGESLLVRRYALNGARAIQAVNKDLRANVLLHRMYDDSGKNILAESYVDISVMTRTIDKIKCVLVLKNGLPSWTPLLSYDGISAIGLNLKIYHVYVGTEQKFNLSKVGLVVRGTTDIQIETVLNVALWDSFSLNNVWKYNGNKAQWENASVLSVLIDNAESINTLIEKMVARFGSELPMQHMSENWHIASVGYSLSARLNMRKAIAQGKRFEKTMTRVEYKAMTIQQCRDIARAEVLTPKTIENRKDTPIIKAQDKRLLVDYDDNLGVMVVTC